MYKKNILPLIIPVMLAFFTMGFAYLVGGQVGAAVVLTACVGYLLFLLTQFKTAR